jgi:RNA polymerase sigma-70 factor (ECF subfamily)
MARGETAALAELIRRHQARLYQLTYRLLKDPLEAEDALQEVFLKAHEHAARFEPKGSVSAWLHRIAANHCFNRLRQRRPQESLDEEDAPALAAPGATPLEALEESQLAARLEELLALLPENQRRALILKRFGDLSYQEIADLMGLSIPAVDGLLKRARQFLKKALKDYLG